MDTAATDTTTSPIHAFEIRLADRYGNNEHIYIAADEYQHDDDAKTVVFTLDDEPVYDLAREYLVSIRDVTNDAKAAAVAVERLLAVIRQAEASAATTAPVS